MAGDGDEGQGSRFWKGSDRPSWSQAKSGFKESVKKYRHRAKDQMSKNEKMHLDKIKSIRESALHKQEEAKPARLLDPVGGLITALRMERPIKIGN